MLVVGPAGNHGTYSCHTFPAESPHAIIVGGTSQLNDLQTISSNYGDCVDIYAPSELITAPLIGQSISKFSYLSGSSASTAIVAGISGLSLSLLKTPLNHFPLDIIASSSYQYLLMILEDQHQEVNLDAITLSSLLTTIVSPTDHLVFLRNILTSVYSSASQNRTKLVHSPSFYPCDYKNLDSLLILIIDSVVHLYQQLLRPRGFLDLKKKLAIHLKEKVEEFYQKNEGWEEDHYLNVENSLETF